MLLVLNFEYMGICVMAKLYIFISVNNILFVYCSKIYKMNLIHGEGRELNVLFHHYYDTCLCDTM